MTGSAGSRASRRALATLVVAVLLVGLVVGLYAACFAIGRLLLPDGTATLPFAIAATTVVALVIEPVRRRLGTGTRRWLRLGSRDPVAVLRELPDRITLGVEAERAPDHLTRILGEGLDAASAQLWVRGAGGFRCASTWPAPVGGTPPAAAAGPAAAEPARLVDLQRPGRHVEPIRHRDQVEAVLVIEHRPVRPLSALEDRLLAAYVHQAGLVVRTLAVRRELLDREQELVSRTAELQESRVRLDAAHRSERRTLERDLHDGAQQQLVAISVLLRRAERLAGRQPGRPDRLLDDVADLTRRTADGLEHLLDQLYPPMLVAEGLAATIRAYTRPLHGLVQVRGSDASGLLALRPEVPHALYLTSMEAIQNAVKHAGASRIVVDVDPGRQAYRIDISDDGVGLDEARTAGGTGLHHMQDRMRRIGGRCLVRSGRTGGTTVTLEAPWTPTPDHGAPT